MDGSCERVHGDFHVRDKFTPEDAEYTPLVRRIKDLQFQHKALFTKDGNTDTTKT